MGEAVEDRRRKAAGPRLLTTGIGAVAVLTLLPPAAVAGPVSSGCSKAGSVFIRCEATSDNAPANEAPGATGNDRARSGGKPPKCVVERMEEQPPPGSMWHAGEGKTAYTRTCKTPGGENGPTTGLAVADGEAPPAIDPAVVAQTAVDQMKLVGPDIDINPKPGGKGLVGMPVWMAVDQSPTTYGPNSASATAGGVTVTATAKVKSIVWDMGDGTSVTCTGPGSVYKKSFGMKASPDCGHRYKQTSEASPGGKFKVSATATWAVDWQVTGGGGESGQLTEVRDSTVALTIVESQAVN